MSELSIDPLLRAATGRDEEDASPPRRPPSHRRWVMAGCAVAMIAALGWFTRSGDGTGEGRVADDSLAPGTSAILAQPPVATDVSNTPAIDQPGSDSWIVNRDRPLPRGYVPPELMTPAVPIKPGTPYTKATPVVAGAFEAMVAAALRDGYELQLTGGYRSFDDQQEMYDRFVRDFGTQVAADRVALPGRSEHQTGLAIDVGEVGLPDDQEFGATASSTWVRDSAHRFGFIVRYPPDKAAITGYANEPWHLRYVGVDLATELHASGLTMEEHFGLAAQS